MWKTLILTGFLMGLFAIPAASFAAKPWCKPGETLQQKNVALRVTGLEKSKKRCILAATIGPITAEYILDEHALAKLRNPNARGTGSGCVRWSITSTAAKTELCFGKE